VGEEKSVRTATDNASASTAKNGRAGTAKPTMSGALHGKSFADQERMLAPNESGG